MTSERITRENLFEKEYSTSLPNREYCPTGEDNYHIMEIAVTQTKEGLVGARI